MVDMAHFAGLVAAGEHPTPFGHAHVVTTTTHKTLRGPRGGMVLTDDEAIAKKINSAVFPGLQGGPLMHVIAAKAVAFGEALQPELQDLCQGGDRQCQGARRPPQGARRRPRRGRHRHPSRAGRPAPARHHRQGRRRGARARRRSPATRTASRSTRCRRSRPAASASARRPAPPAASASPSSATSPTWSPTCSTGLQRERRRGQWRGRGATVKARVRDAVRPLPDLSGANSCAAPSAPMKTAR